LLACFNDRAISRVEMRILPVAVTAAIFGRLPSLQATRSFGFGSIIDARSTSSSSSRSRRRSIIPNVDVTTALSSVMIHAGGAANRMNNSHSSSGDDSDVISTHKNAHLLPLWKLATAHCASQALRVLLQLKIPDILGNGSCSIQEIAKAIQQHSSSSTLPLPDHIRQQKQQQQQQQQVMTKDLLRILRVLTTVDILHETLEKSDGGQQASICFSLTSTGRLLQSNNINADDDHGSGAGGLATGIQHWMEAPLWNSWLHIPAYLQDGLPLLPFERANDGVSSDYYYNERDHPASLQLANDFVRWIHQQEVQAVAHGFDWSSIENTNQNDTSSISTTRRHRRAKLLDIGGHYGSVASAIAAAQPQLDCYSLDLPHVIAKAPATTNVQLIAGNVLDQPSTLPSDCDVILLKHFLDRCMWNETRTVQILQSCHDALLPSGIVVIAEAVLPDIGAVTTAAADAATCAASLSLSMDAMYMMVGREGQRTLQEWRDLAHASGFVISTLQHTNVPSCSILVLRKK
jgi:precorrin-6B methylase 2